MTDETPATASSTITAAWTWLMWLGALSGALSGGFVWLLVQQQLPIRMAYGCLLIGIISVLGALIGGGAAALRYPSEDNWHARLACCAATLLCLCFGYYGFLLIELRTLIAENGFTDYAQLNFWDNAIRQQFGAFHKRLLYPSDGILLATSLYLAWKLPYWLAAWKSGARVDDDHADAPDEADSTSTTAAAAASGASPEAPEATEPPEATEA